jgi:phosphoenolpyruvate-protein phosphotransferase (PTS system enzyme I)
MRPTLRAIYRGATTHPALVSIGLGLTALWIDVSTGRDVLFQLIYVLPVALAALNGQQALAYGLATVPPLLADLYELPRHSGLFHPIAGIYALNALIEAFAMLLYAYLIGKIAQQTRQLRTRITTRETELGRLRAFARRTSTILQGCGLSPGMIEGVAYIHQPLEVFQRAGQQPIAADQVPTDRQRLDLALTAAIGELEGVRGRFVADPLGAEHALLDVQLAMLQDRLFWDKCRRRVGEELIGAGQVVAEEVEELAAMLEGSAQAVMVERSADIRDVGRRVLRHIAGPGSGDDGRLAGLAPGTVLVAKELLPSELLGLDLAHLVALVTEHNGPTSHVAILARTRSIPAVSDIKDATSLLSNGDHLLVDAEAGTVTVAPTHSQAQAFAERRSRYAESSATPALDLRRPCLTRDGVQISLYANIDRTDEARLVREYGLQGVGLFRSEFLFLNVPRPPDLEAQAAAYAAVVQALAPQPVTIRTMDFGGDKLPHFTGTACDMALRAGRRGLALSLSERTLFRTQLQAILRAAPGGSLRIMFPMVTGVADLAEARQILAEIAAAERLPHFPLVGAMIETPAAVLHVQELAAMVDFLSIGTNDLAHFVLAMERRVQQPQHQLLFLHPGVLRATQRVAQAAQGRGIGLSVCGEAAGDPAAACLMIGMGIRDFSVSPIQSEPLRRALEQATLGGMELALEHALEAGTPEQVREIALTALEHAD